MTIVIVDEDFVFNVEDGSIVEGAESYISIQDCLNYHEKHGNNLWMTITTNQMAEALRRATDYMTAKYRTRWKGTRVKPLVQDLDWPRTGVVIEKVAVPSNIVPKEIKNACAELAYRASMGPLIDESSSSGGSAGGAVIQETVGPITVKYAPPTAETMTKTSSYEQIDLMLAPFLGGSSGVMTKLTRV